MGRQPKRDLEKEGKIRERLVLDLIEAKELGSKPNPSIKSLHQIVGCQPALEMALQIYVSIMGEDRIAHFTMDADTGNLTPRGDIAISDRPAPLTVNPQRRYLYVGCRDENRISGFRLYVARLQSRKLAW